MTDTIFHVGSAYSIRDDRGGTVRFRGRLNGVIPPRMHLSTHDFVDTGDILASDYNLYQAEMAWVAGAFSFSN